MNSREKYAIRTVGREMPKAIGCMKSGFDYKEKKKIYDHFAKWIRSSNN